MVVVGLYRQRRTTKWLRLETQSALNAKVITATEQSMISYSESRPQMRILSAPRTLMPWECRGRRGKSESAQKCLTQHINAPDEESTCY